MLNPKTTDLRVRKGLAALGLCVILGMPLPAAGQVEGSGPNPQPAAAQDSSSRQASASQPAVAAGTAVSSDSTSPADPAPAAAASDGASSPEASSSSSSGSDAQSAPAAAVNQYSTTSATATAGSTSSQGQVAGTVSRGQVGGRDAQAPLGADAGWTPSTAINAWLPQWLKFSGEFRDRFEAHTAYGFEPGVNDEFNLTRVRLGLDVIPTPWFHAFVQARDSEAFGEQNPAHITTSMRDVFDLNQAYVEFRNGDNGWFSLKAGRQELEFGDQRLVGTSHWSNATRSWDMVRLSLGSDNVGSWLNNIGARLDLFGGSVVKNYYTSFDEIQPGHNFYGFNLALTKIIPRASIEPYVYLKSVPSVTAVDKKKGNERLYTSGVRVGGTIPGGFDYRLRYSYQSGHYSVQGIDAWAGYGTLGYTIPGTRYQPRFSIEYNYASGNKSIGAPTVGTFDLLYPTTHQWDRITDLFGEQNIRDLKPGFDFRPAPKLKVRFVFSNLHLASRYDSLYDYSGAVLVKVPKGGALSTAIGNEADVYGTYDINKRWQLGAGFGHLIAGDFLKQNTPGANASYPYVFLDYLF